MVGPNRRLARAGDPAADAAGPAGWRTPGNPGAPPHRRTGPGGRVPWWYLAALPALLGAFAVDLYGLFDDRRVNRALSQNQVALVAEHDTLRGALARAYRLHGNGELSAAVAAYGAVALDEEPELRAVQLFNLANLYLEQAVALERADEMQSSVSLVELAKQNYREILARDPRHWDARHNLSRALEMLPDIAAVDYENERNPERSPRARQAARTYEGLP